MLREAALVLEALTTLLTFFPSGGDIKIENFGSGATVNFKLHGNYGTLTFLVIFKDRDNVFIINGLVFPKDLRNQGIFLKILSGWKRLCERDGCGLFVVQAVDRLCESLLKRGGTLHGTDDIDIMTMTDFSKNVA